MGSKSVNYGFIVDTLKKEIEEIGQELERVTDLGMSGYLTSQKLLKKHEELENIERFLERLNDRSKKNSFELNL